MFPPGTFSGEPDPPDDEVEEAEEPTAEAEDAGEEPDATDETEGADEAPSLIGGKFKSQDDLLKAYEELQREYHAKNQRQAEPEPDEDDQNEDPFGLWGTTFGNDEAQKLAQIIIDEPYRAQEVIEWVAQNPDQFGPHGAQVFNGLYGMWFNQAPAEANQWHLEQIIAQRESEREQQYEERLAPLQQQHAQQMMNAAVARAHSEIPGVQENWQEIMNRIAAPQVQQIVEADPSYRSDPDKMYGLILAAAQQIAWEQHVENTRRAASDVPAAETTTKKPRTQARSTAAKPAPDAGMDLFPPGTFREAG